jgi:hypothetical protein
MTTPSRIPSGRREARVLASAAALAAAILFGATATHAAPGKPAAKDSTMTLHGGQEGTELRSMTIEGEDRVHIEFERPTLDLDIDFEKVPGLERGTALDVLDRTLPDLTTPFLALSAKAPSPYMGRPWLRQFASGAVARFRPDVRGVERWKLLIANARGETVATYEGAGDPPKEIAWDGRTQSGEPVVPGLTYSYVFEARDRAGNKRNFVGDGFAVAAYRLDGAGGPAMVFSGRDLAASGATPGPYERALPGGRAKSPLLLVEAASWINQSSRIQEAIQVQVSARTFDEAKSLAARATETLVPRTLGGAARLQVVTDVSPGAPEEGAIAIRPAR